jgi:hypothetical protein
MSDGIKLAAESLDFEPSAAMKKAYARFWVEMRENPIASADDVTCAMAVQLTGENRINQWWRLPGFKEWFCNKNEWRHRAENLMSKWLDACEFVLSDPDVYTKQLNAVMQMGKVLVDVTGRAAPSRKEVKLLDTDLNKMSKEQLQDFVKKGLKAAE